MPGGTPGPQGWEWGRAWSAGCGGLRGRAPFLALLAAGSREVVGVGCWILECKAEGRPGPLSPPAARQPPSELTGGILVPTGPGPWGKPQSSVGGAFFTTPPSCSRFVGPRQPPLALTAWAPGPMWWEQQPRPAWLWVFSFFGQPPSRHCLSQEAAATCRRGPETGKAPGPSHAGLGCPLQVPLQPPRGSEVSTAGAPRDTGKTVLGATLGDMDANKPLLPTARCGEQEVRQTVAAQTATGLVSRAWTSGHSSKGSGEWGEGQTESCQQARSCCLQLSPGGR